MRHPGLSKGCPQQRHVRSPSVLPSATPNNTPLDAAHSSCDTMAARLDSALYLTSIANTGCITSPGMVKSHGSVLFPDPLVAILSRSHCSLCADTDSRNLIHMWCPSVGSVRRMSW